MRCYHQQQLFLTMGLSNPRVLTEFHLLNLQIKLNFDENLENTLYFLAILLGLYSGFPAASTYDVRKLSKTSMMKSSSQRKSYILASWENNQGIMMSTQIFETHVGLQRINFRML